MESVLGIFASIDDPRDHTARYELPVLLFIALAATLCGARSCVDIADFVEANRAELIDILDLPVNGTPSHDTFSRLFCLLDPQQMEATLHRFGAAMRQGLGLGPAEGVVAVDGKRLRRGYERGRASMPPLMVGIWDAETRLSIAARAGLPGAWRMVKKDWRPNCCTGTCGHWNLLLFAMCFLLKQPKFQRCASSEPWVNEHNLKHP